MRLIVVTTLFPNNVEPGRGIFVFRETMALRKYCDVRVIAPVPYFPPVRRFPRWYPYSQVESEEQYDGMEVFHPRYLALPKAGRSLHGLAYFLSVLPLFRRLMAEERADLLLSHYAYPDGFAASLLSLTFGLPLVIKVRGSDVNVYMKTGLRRRMTLFAIRRAQKVIAVSYALAERLGAQGLTRDRVEVIQNGVDTSLFRPMERDRCREALGLPFSSTLILYVGNLKKEKGIDLLMRACVGLKDGRPWSLAVVGEGPFGPRLRGMAEEMGIADRVLFAGSHRPEEIPIWMNACDLLCLPSLTEGYPNVLAEAVACGTPVVATRVGGAPEIIDSKDKGVLVSPGDVSSLTEGLLEAMEGRGRRKGRRSTGPVRSWDDVARETFELLKGIVQ